MTISIRNKQYQEAMRQLGAMFGVKDEKGMQQYFNGIAKNKQDKIMQFELLIYECEGTESEIKEWFETINIAGVPLTEQEKLNAIYSGPFVTLAKEEFSNSQNSNIQKWGAYIKGSANRQEFLARALDWVSKGNIGDYMSKHRKDTNINELKIYFNSVIDWVSKTFIDVEKEMKGLIRTVFLMLGFRRWRSLTANYMSHGGRTMETIRIK